MGQLVEDWKTYFDYLKHPDNYKFPVRKPGFPDKKRPHRGI